jgi:hypothetical protein
MIDQRQVLTAIVDDRPDLIAGRSGRLIIGFVSAFWSVNGLTRDVSAVSWTDGWSSSGRRR